MNTKQKLVLYSRVIDYLDGTITKRAFLDDLKANGVGFDALSKEMEKLQAELYGAPRKLDLFTKFSASVPAVVKDEGVKLRSGRSGHRQLFHPHCFEVYEKVEAKDRIAHGGVANMDAGSSFMAMFPGRCWACGKSIEPNDEIVLRTYDGPVGVKGLVE